MKHSDIRRGEAYLISDGRNYSLTYNARRCVVLDTETGYRNRHDMIWEKYLRENRVERGEPRWSYRRTNSTPRLLVAVEEVVMAPASINPETGEPWTDEDLDLVPGDPVRRYATDALNPREKAIPVARLWYPFAARPFDLKAPWSAVEAAVEQQERERRLSYRVRCEQAERNAIEAERKRAEDAERSKQLAKERAERDEFYETRIEPTLVDLGVIGGVTRYAGDGKVTIRLDELHRLLGHIEARSE